MKRIFDGDREMNVIAFASGSGSNFEALAKDSRKEGSNYQVRALFVDKMCKGMGRAERLGIPVIYESAVKFIGGTRSQAEKDGWIDDYEEKSCVYDAHVADMLRQYAEDNGFNIDLIELAGYMRIVNDPLLRAFPDKIINVHPADLGIFHEDGKRKYIGDNAVLWAIASGEDYTASTVHLITSEVDAGEMLVLSECLKVDRPQGIGKIIDVSKELIRANGSIEKGLEKMKDVFLEQYNLLEEFCDYHQDRQKENCDWPAYITATRMVSEGRFSISDYYDSFNVRGTYLDNKILPYRGFEL